MTGSFLFGCLRPDSNQHTLKAHAPEACVSTISPLRPFEQGKDRLFILKNPYLIFNFFKNI